MGNLREDSDPEAGYISSDESAHAADLGERLRVKPSRDIWELGKFLHQLVRPERGSKITTYCLMMTVW